MLKLISLKTGKEIKPDEQGNLYCQRGAVKGDKFIFGELIAPTPENPQGYVRSKKTGITFNEYYPIVFNAKIIEE